MPTTVFNKQYGGPDCITCCPVEIACDCALLECVMDFYRYALNVNKAQYMGHQVHEVAHWGLYLVGFAALGAYERPVIAGTAQVDFGRSLTQALIQEWQVEGAQMQTKFQEVERVLAPYLDGYLKDFGCDEANVDRVECQALKCTFDTIKSFNRIGQDNKVPYTLKEWAEGGLSGVCYEDCEGNDYIFDKVA